MGLEAWVQLGRISGLYGVKGWVKVFSYTEPRDSIIKYPRWFLVRNGQRTEVVPESGRGHGKGVVAKLEGVDDRDQAAQWIGADIEVPRADLPPSEDGSWYWTDLIGLEVVNLKGERLGQVETLLETGANDVLVVQGERERLIPFILERFVKKIDLDAGLIEVDWDREF